MSYNFPEMEVLKKKGLGLSNYYQRHFLYQPQSSSRLIAEIRKLKDCGSKREDMLDFLRCISDITENEDETSDEGFFSTVSNFWKTNPNESQQKAKEIEKQKAWVLTGALVYIRYKIAMEYDAGIFNAWGWLGSTDPNSSKLFKEMGVILCPFSNRVGKPLYDRKRQNEDVNYFALAESLSALRDFIDKMEILPKYLTDPRDTHRLDQLEEFLYTCTNATDYQVSKIHLDTLEKQERVISSIDAFFKLAQDEIKKIPQEAFQSVSELKKAAVSLNCQPSIKTLFTWMSGQITEYNVESREELKATFSDTLIPFYKYTMVGAQYLLSASYERGIFEAEDKVIETLNDSINNDILNQIDLDNPKDLETMVRALKVYKGLAQTFPDQEVHQALWEGRELGEPIDDTISKLTQRIPKITLVPNS